MFRTSNFIFKSSFCKKNVCTPNPTISVQNVEGFHSMTVNNYLLLAMAALLYMGEGMNSSLLAPFFPNEAILNGHMTLQIVSIIMGSFEVSKLLAIILLSFFVNPSNQMAFFYSGALISSAFCLFFGYLPRLFTGKSITFFFIFVQFVQGFGASMVFMTGNPIFVAFFEGKEARVTSTLESALGIGILIGPALGSLLYSLGGYQLPFTVVGSAEFLFSLVSMILMILMSRKRSYISLGNEKDFDAEQKISHLSDFDQGSLNVTKIVSTNCSVRAFVKNTSILCASLPTLLMAVGSGCITVTLAPFLLDQFDIGSSQNGYYFLCFGATYSGGAFLIGFFGDKGYSFHLPLILLPVGFLGYLCLSCMNFIPWMENRYTVLVILAIEGFCHVGGAFVPAFRNVEKIALLEGFRDVANVRLTTTNMLVFIYILGRVIGVYVAGGLLSVYVGFHAGVLAVAVLIVSSWVAFCYPVYKLDLLSPF